MNIWAAIYLEEQLCQQKEAVKAIESEIGFEQSNISALPMHVSLKISTEIPEEKEGEIRRDLLVLLESIPAFTFPVKGVELNGSIVWIEMDNDPHLVAIHESLCSLFRDKYGIEPHALDGDFVFHSTLFLDSDTEKIEEAYARVRGMALPEKLTADTFLIGSSPEGKIGTYTVDTMVKARFASEMTAHCQLPQ